MKTISIKIVLFLCVFAQGYWLNAQQLCGETKIEVVVDQETSVYVYKEYGTNEKPVFYYVPTTLGLSISKTGQPEYSFQEYIIPGKNQPEAILHLMVTWGLTQNQLGVLKQCIREKYGEQAIVAGAMYLDNSASKITFNTATELGKILKASLKSSSVPITMSGGKMAMSFQFKGADVATIRNAIKSPNTFKNTIIGVSYIYTTKTCKRGIRTAIRNNIILKGYLRKWF